MVIPEKYMKYIIWILLLTGFVARLFAFRMDFHFDNDVHIFQSWAIRLFEYGLGGFYAPDMHLDYPPVYLYVLYLIGALRSWAGVQTEFGMQHWPPVTSTAFNFFTFLPAILADLGIGFIVYKVAARKKDIIFALFVAAAWVFNPAVILISASWGQMESVFIIFLLGSLIFLRRKKLLPAYILFGLAIFTKPQSLFLGPVYLYSAYDFLRVNKYFGRSFLKLAASIFAGIGVMVLVALPFGLRATWGSLMYGMGLYGHATVNASNFWAMIDANWGNLETPFLGFILTKVNDSWGAWATQSLGFTFEHVGYFVVLAIISGALTALHIDYTKHDCKHFYLIVGALFTIIFAFSMRMHERYLFPGLVFFLMYYLENRERREFIFYWGFSAVFFLNCLEVLRWANSGYDWEMLGNSSIRAVSFVTVLLAVSLIVVLVKSLRGKYSEKIEEIEPKKKSAFAGRETAPPMRRRDYVHIGILIAVYSIVAFWNLGDTQSPQTTWVASENNNSVEIDFGEVVNISQFQFLMGARHDIPFDLHTSNNGNDWEFIHSQQGACVFAWHFIPLHTDARFVMITARDGLRLQEIAFRNENSEILQASVSPGGENLMDEQHLVPEKRSFMNSTYFDEIYHPRTGYEFVHGLWVYETTHPPLGKVFMAESIRMFGMTPFGWRFPGTLFGIFMLPLIYAFARKLLKSNNFALFTAFIFAFDFILFSHTRLATIDSFVTFFVIAMYFLMYWYTSEIERNSFEKSLLLLALCGAAMGLAIASKWQGVYGAIGLPILLFPSLYKLYLRNKQQATITFFACFGFFVAVPIFIYALSYIPFVNAMNTDTGFIKTVWQNQESMLSYHSEGVLGSEHPFASQWWTWPLIQTPLWQYLSVISDTHRAGMSSMGSPAVWWFGIVATGFAIFGLAKKSRFDYDTAFLLVAYAANFLPWVFITRLTFIYHYFPSVPFVVLLITLFFKRYVKSDYFYFAYAGLVFALFVLFYPVISGMPVSVDFVAERLRWLSGWIFV